MDIMIFDKRNRRFGMMFIFALLLSSIEYTHGQVSLSGCANPVVYSSCDLTCQTPDQSADAVKFFKPPNLSSVIAQCTAGGTCGALTGYSIQRSTPTTTVFTILNYTCTDSVTWRCDYNSNFATHDSPCVDFPQTATTTDISDNSVLNSSVVITVNLGCLVSQGTVQMKFDYKNSGGTIVDSSALSTCSNVSTCTDPLYSTYECQINLRKESNILCETKYSIEANVKISDAVRTESIHLLNDVEFTCQSTDSCDSSYWYCIGVVLIVDFIASVICTVLLVVWRIIKGESFICWLARHIFCCCAQKIKSCCEKIKYKNICGIPAPLLLDVFVIDMLIWLCSIIAIISICCTCEESQTECRAVGIFLSLIVIALGTATVLSACLISSFWKTKLNGDPELHPNHIKKEAGDNVNILEQRAHDFKKIKSIDLTKDGEKVSSDQYEVEMTTCPSLTLKMVSLDQSGKYECTISYDLTKKEVHQLNLLVTPKQYEIKMGEKKNLLKFLNSLNTVEDVTWIHNFETIPADSYFYKGGTKRNPSLTVKYCSTSDSGLYICHIRTKQGSKQFSAQLNIKDTYTVNSGKNIDLLNDLSSYRGIKQISWEINGKPLTLAENPSYIGGTKDRPVLTVNYATKEEAGKYTCILEFESQTTKEFNFKLDVNEQWDVNSGESIVLFDNLGNCVNATSVEWTYKKGQVSCLHTGGTIECPALTIPVVSLEDSGEYECKLTLQHENIRLYRFVLTVNVQQIKKEVGDEVILLKNLTSVGTIKGINWYKNGRKVPANSDLKYQGGVNKSPGLSLGSLRQDDSGRYECDIITESQIKLHIPVDLTVEKKENTTRLGPIRHNRVHNSTENIQSSTEKEK